MKRVLLIFVGLGLVLGLLVSTLFSEQLAWRVQILTLKGSGELQEVTWSETLRWMLPNAPVYLGNLVHGRNPQLALRNVRYTTGQDVASGRELYRQMCVSCHGSQGEGASGPALTGGGAALSDWSIYRAVQRGIPGTAMPAHHFPDRDVWQIVAFISTLHAGNDVATPRQPQVEVSTVPYLRIASAELEPANWLTYSGRYAGWRFSELTEIDTQNVSNLTLKWLYQADTTYRKFQANPIVVDGVMFITVPPGRVVALDAASGEVFWEFDRPVPGDLVLCCGVSNRGVAVLDDKVFVATIDAHLLALDSRSGRLLWDVEVANYRDGYSITSAPLAIDGLVITGVAGGETGTRGLLAAYDPETGERAWRFDTVPAPGEPGSETWSDDVWRYGGASTWMTGSYDPQRDLLYWGTSHSVHRPENKENPDDQLYGSSILALRGRTGELVWHFQATPHDLHGFDAAQVPILLDVDSEDEVRHLLVTANRNGYLYVLDRESGEFISGIPFVRQTWSLGLNEDGRPAVNPDALPTPEGTLSWPSSVGATNWWPPTFNPVTGKLCFTIVDGPSVFYSQDMRYVRGRPYVPVIGQRAPDYPTTTAVRCMDPLTARVAWQEELKGQPGTIVMTGVLSTAGGLLFGSDVTDFYAVDVESGERLWQVNAGEDILAAPVTYKAGGEQYVAVASGKVIMVFGLPRIP